MFVFLLLDGGLEIAGIPERLVAPDWVTSRFLRGDSHSFA